jgi:hypothetical protein
MLKDNKVDLIWFDLIWFYVCWCWWVIREKNITTNCVKNAWKEFLLQETFTCDCYKKLLCMIATRNVNVCAARNVNVCFVQETCTGFIEMCMCGCCNKKRWCMLPTKHIHVLVWLKCVCVTATRNVDVCFLQEACRVNVHNLAQAANWCSLVKNVFGAAIVSHLSNWPKVTDLGYINLKEGTRLQLQRRFYQTAPICNLCQIVHIYPTEMMYMMCMYDCYKARVEKRVLWIIA